MINLSSLEIKNKNLVIRVDMNVPISGGKVLDATRITACIPTINYALKNNAKILITKDPREAAKDADCIMTDKWVSMNDKVNKKAKKKWKINFFT